MKIVNSNSELDIRKAQIADKLTLELRAMAANLLRVIRGAGKPHELLLQFEQCAAALREYASLHGHLPPSHDLRRMLNCDQAFEDGRPWVQEYREARGGDPRQDLESQIDDAKRQIRDASLQIVASMLVDQLTQKSTAENDLFRGVYAMEEARTAGRERLLGDAPKRKPRR